MTALKAVGQDPDCEVCPLPTLLRWPKNRFESATRQEEKILMVLNILDSQSVVTRGLQEFALEAFCPTLSAFEARILIQILMHKDGIQYKKSQNMNDVKGKVLRLTN